MLAHGMLGAHPLPRALQIPMPLPPPPQLAAAGQAPAHSQSGTHTSYAHMCRCQLAFEAAGCQLDIGLIPLPQALVHWQLWTRCVLCCHQLGAVPLATGLTELRSACTAACPWNFATWHMPEGNRACRLMTDGQSHMFGSLRSSAEMVALAVASGMAAARQSKSGLSAMQLSCDLAFRALVETNAHLSVCRFQSGASAWTACQWLPTNTASGSRCRRTSATLTVVLRQLHAASCSCVRYAYTALRYGEGHITHCLRAGDPCSSTALHLCWLLGQVSGHIYWLCSAVAVASLWELTLGALHAEQYAALCRGKAIVARCPSSLTTGIILWLILLAAFCCDISDLSAFQDGDGLPSIMTVQTWQPRPPDLVFSAAGSFKFYNLSAKGCAHR